VTHQASKWLYLAVPVQANSASCMKCHGQPEEAPADLLRQYGDKAGFFEKLGNKRALISIRVPMAGILAQGRDQARTLILITFLSLAAVYLLIFVESFRLPDNARNPDAGGHSLRHAAGVGDAGY
jgi:hypothetical protein